MCLPAPYLVRPPFTPQCSAFLISCEALQRADSLTIISPYVQNLDVNMIFVRFCSLLSVLGTLCTIVRAYSFINPASYGGQTSFSQNAVYAEKSILQIQWTVGTTDQDATVVLFQVNTSTTLASDDSPDVIGGLEYIAGKLHFARLRMCDPVTFDEAVGNADVW